MARMAKLSGHGVDATAWRSARRERQRAARAADAGRLTAALHRVRALEEQLLALQAARGVHTEDGHSAELLVADRLRRLAPCIWAQVEHGLATGQPAPNASGLVPTGVRELGNHARHAAFETPVPIGRSAVIGNEGLNRARARRTGTARKRQQPRRTSLSLICPAATRSTRRARRSSRRRCWGQGREGLGELSLAGLALCADHAGPRPVHEHGAHHEGPGLERQLHDILHDLHDDHGDQPAALHLAGEQVHREGGLGLGW